MPLLTMLLTFPLLYLAYDKNHEFETSYPLKLIIIWAVCQLYITLNLYMRIPVGIAAASIYVWNEHINKYSKFLALIIGFISLISSIIVYLLYRL